MNEAEKIVDPFLNVFKIMADATAESDRCIVELVKETITRINKLHDNDLVALNLIQTMAARIVTLEAKVDMLMELHRQGDE